MSELEPSAPFSLFKGHKETIESSSSECINRAGFSSKIPDHLFNNFGKIKLILNRTSFCFVVTEDDELFMQYSSGWCKLETSFKFPNERIVHISASYQAVLITLQSGFSNNITTRVFAHHTRPDILISVYYGEKRTEIQENSVSLERDVESDVDLTKIWYRVEDLDSLLNEGEYVTYTSCAAFTCCFITSHGRLLACGSNQFGEIARPAHTSYVNRVLPCDLEPANNCKEPFFIKTVNGDHNIIALTKDHNILQCGYKASARGLDLKKMTQVEKMIEMDQDEYFIDICASYYGKLYLTSKFN